ncbi:MAG: hypothetical protein PUI40_10825 [Oscillospiraceae bacterium]|nr:hypothetical protein [Oscillospiraceae bacterium]MDD7042429.1 hypothetical protein [Oscillospiraceae bacterium]MDY2611102.1 hypothetical protein [Oscillospiraceae bacterium]
MSKRKVGLLHLGIFEKRMWHFPFGEKPVFFQAGGTYVENPFVRSFYPKDPSFGESENGRRRG